MKKDGVYKEHYDDGKVKSISIYKKGMRIHQKDFIKMGIQNISIIPDC